MKPSKFKSKARRVAPYGRSQLQTFLLYGVLCSALLFCVGAPAQYSISKFVIAGGGGTSAGGVYSVSGTIGQPDAGVPMTNGQYSVTGGFWPTAIQVEGAPTLVITGTAPGQLSISWSPNTTGFVLQQTTLIAPANWTNSPSGATNPIVVPTVGASRFYRLSKP